MLVGHLLFRGGYEAQPLVGIAWGAFHLLELRLRLLNKHLLQCTVDTLYLGARVPDAVVLSRSVRPISVRCNSFPGLIGFVGLGGFWSLLLHLRKTHPKKILKPNSSGGGTSCVEAVAQVDVGAGRIDGRLTQDGQSQRCPSRRDGTGELANATDRQPATKQCVHSLISNREKPGSLDSLRR
jgi:hypothetical protein